MCSVFIPFLVSGTESGSSQVQPTVAEALTIIEDQIANSLLSITLQTKEYQVFELFLGGESFD